MERNLKKYQSEYLKQPFEPIQSEIRRNHVLNWLKENEYDKGNLLEVGCGNNSLVNYLNSFNNFQIVEPGKEFYNKACDDIKLHEKRGQIKVCNNSIEEFNKNIDYNVIIVSCLLHEIHDQPGFIKAIINLMNSQTLLYIDVPNAYSFHRLLAKELGYISDVFQKSQTQINMQQNEIFSMDTLVSLLTEHGFTILEKDDFIFKPFTHSQMQLLIDNEIFSKEFILGLAKMSKYTPDIGSEIYITAKYNF